MLVIILNFQEDHTENWLKIAFFFDTGSAIKQASQLEMT